MSFLRTIASDLVEKRLWPLVVLLLVGLIGVVGYVAMHGGGSAPPPSRAASLPPLPGSGPVPVTAAGTNANAAFAETTSGIRFQRQGGAHDPFTPLVAAVAKASSAVAPAPSTPVKIAAPTTAGTTAPQTAASTPTTSVPKTTTPPATTPTQPTGGQTPSSTGGTPAVTHHVEVRFGTVPTAAGQPPAQLADYKDLARLTPLPDATGPVVVFLGVRQDGQTVTFTLMHEAILRGNGVCRPDALKCQLLDLKPGQSEQMDFLTPSLTVARYELDVVGVTDQPATSTATARSFYLRVSPVGRDVLKHHIQGAMGGLLYSTARGVLVSNPTAPPALLHSAGQDAFSTKPSSRGWAVSRSPAAGGAGAARAVAPAPSWGSTSAERPAAPASPAWPATGNAAYAPPPPHSGPPVVQPGWLDMLLRAL